MKAHSFNTFFTSTFLQSHKDFVAILDLPEGEHQYKFFVDGQWVHDVSEVRQFNVSARNLFLFLFPDPLLHSPLWPVSWAPSTTWSRWRSRTLRCLTRCRSTRWSARTRQVGPFCDADVNITAKQCNGYFCSGQICPVPPLVPMGRNSTSADRRPISKPRPSSLHTSSKSFSTRTQIYLWVSPPFLLCLDVSLL